MQTATHTILDSLAKDYRRQLAAAAYHLCGDRDAAQDIVQDTLVAAFRGIDRLREPEKVKPWLYTILRRKALEHRRGRRMEVELTSEIEAPDQIDTEAVVRRIMIEQMDRLSEDDREILAGKYLLGLTYQELSESVGIKEGAIRVRCFRAKERLREVLRGTGLHIPEERR